MEAAARRRRPCHRCGRGLSTRFSLLVFCLASLVTRQNLRTHTRVAGSGGGREGERADGKGSGGVVMMNRSALVDEIVLRPPQVEVAIMIISLAKTSHLFLAASSLVASNLSDKLDSRVSRRHRPGGRTAFPSRYSTLYGLGDRCMS
jgi:hypothetical protein